MTDLIQQARRAAFEAWWSAEMNLQMMDLFRHGDGYQCHETNRGWMAFNAALDCVVIELPKNEIAFQTDERFNIRRAAIRECRTAIASTNLGLRIK